MKSTPSRRGFLKLAAISGGAYCCCPVFAHAGMSDTEKAAFRDELLVAAQTREARERMLLFRKLVAKYGQDLVHDVEQHTIETTRERFADPKFEQRDLEGIKGYLWDQLGQGFEFTCEHDAPDRLEYRVSKCFLAEVVAEHGSPELGHAFYCAWDLGFCQGLNPKIKFTRSTTLMQGDECCNHTYVLE